MRNEKPHIPPPNSALNVQLYRFGADGNLRLYSYDRLFFALYGYDGGTTRTYKYSMDLSPNWVNGRLENVNFNLRNAMFYPNSYLNFNQDGHYTKHYYNGMERIASRLGDRNISINVSDPDLQDRKDWQDSLIRKNIVEITGYEFLEPGEEQTLEDPKPVFELPQVGITGLQPIGSGDIFYYHPNHLGSTCYVTDGNASVQQGFLYAPFGEITNEHNSSFGSSVIPKYSFNAKELDEETGMYYYEARYMAPPVFVSRDPLFEKYPTFSPYAYCVNNPVKYVDPDGRDVWEVNETGEIVNRIKDKTQDAFYMVAKDANGNYQRTFTTDAEGNKNYNSISFKYGTVESQRTTALNSTDSYDTYKVRGDANGTQMFEFMSQNTIVEWSQAKTGVEGDKGLNFLTTSHDAAKERGMANLYSGQLYAGYTIRELNHNHPSNTWYPSGSFVDPITGLGIGEWGDVGFARSITNNRQTNRLNVPIFQIYLPSSKSYVNYNSNSVRSDYER